MLVQLLVAERAELYTVLPKSNFISKLRRIVLAKKDFMKVFTSKNKGFTLIELLVVVAIISLLSSVVLSSLNSARAKARDARRMSDLQQIRNALNLHASDNNGSFRDGAFYTSWLDSGHAANDWRILETALASYIKPLPIDPNTKGCHNQGGSCSGYDSNFYFYTKRFTPGSIGLTNWNTDSESAGSCKDRTLLMLSSTETGLVNNATLSKNLKECQFKTPSDYPNAIIMVIN